MASVAYTETWVLTPLIIWPRMANRLAPLPVLLATSSTVETVPLVIWLVRTRNRYSPSTGLGISHTVTQRRKLSRAYWESVVVPLRMFHNAPLPDGFRGRKSLGVQVAAVTGGLSRLFHGDASGAK